MVNPTTSSPLPLRRRLVAVVAIGVVAAILVAALPLDLGRFLSSLLGALLVLAVAAVGTELWLVRPSLADCQRLRSALAENVAERRRAEDALHDHARDLEGRVEERTRELRAAQERLLRQERLAFLGQLAGGVSHELRRPLGAISNAVYFLKLKHGDGDEQSREQLELIRAEIKNMDKIIHDLLDALRIRQQAAERVELGAWLQTVLDRRPPPAGVAVRREIPAGLPSVWMDRAQIEQVVDNLVANAYQAMPDGGELEVRAAVADEHVSMVFRDTGCGIPAEARERIFEPLFTTKARGIGLGLTISKNFVEANGGRLEVESEVGEGATFTVVLPRGGPADEATPAPPGNEEIR